MGGEAVLGRPSGTWIQTAHSQGFHPWLGWRVPTGLGSWRGGFVGSIRAAHSAILVGDRRRITNRPFLRVHQPTARGPSQSLLPSPPTTARYCWGRRGGLSNRPFHRVQKPAARGPSSSLLPSPPTTARYCWRRREETLELPPHSVRQPMARGQCQSLVASPPTIVTLNWQSAP